MADSLRLKLDHNNRKRKIKRLMEATGKGRKSEAVDIAIQYYLHMGETDVGHRVGAVNDLMEAAAERGSLTAPEIAEILDCDELPVSASTNYNVGHE